LTSRLEALTDRAERLVEAAGIFQSALRERDLRLVVVGGSAITAWDPRIHTSLDIDFVGPGLRAELDDVFRGEFGLEVEGRHWYDVELRLAVERPGVVLEPPGSEAVELETPSGAIVLVIALEDLILDRVREWDATGAYDAWVQAARMLAHAALDRPRLDRRASEVGVPDVLAVMEWLAAEHSAGRAIGVHESHRAHDGMRGGGGLDGAMDAIASDAAEDL
jgi:hypothetical protein